MPTAAIYCRISQDRNGEGAGTDRQEKDCRSLCKREGLTVGRVFTDDDRSAYNGKPRPAFEELLSNLEHFDALVYWKNDRLVRRVMQFFKVLEACEQAGVRLVSVVDPIDTSSPLGKGVAGMVASMAEQESHNTSTRIQRKDADNAAAGRYHGGRRAFGYTSDGMTVVDAEADAIREARDRVMAGDSFLSIVQDWNRRGIRPPSAEQWRSAGLKKVLTSGRIAGLRTYRGEIVGDAVWPAIISRRDRDRLVALLGDPQRRRRGRPANYPLSGVLRCGRCDQVMYAASRAGGQRQWRCKSLPGDRVPHCGKLSAVAEPVDTVVIEALLERLDSAAVRRAIRTKTKRNGGVDAAALVAELEERLVQLGKDQDAGLIDRKEWLARRGPLQERLNTARTELSVPERDDAAAFAQLDGPGDIHARWANLSLNTQRAIVGMVIDRVVVNPPPSRGARFDPERVDVVWRA
jgi:DNA invertase Pin-like site-specific DNA recombinase